MSLPSNRQHNMDQGIVASSNLTPIAVLVAARFSIFSVAACLRTCRATARAHRPSTTKISSRAAKNALRACRAMNHLGSLAVCSILMVSTVGAKGNGLHVELNK